MNISQLSEKIGVPIVTSKYNDINVKNGYTSDLLSDVIGFAEEESVLITIQAHKNTIAVAVQLDLAGVIICNDRQISDELKNSAEENGIALLASKDNQFNTSFKVHKALFPES